MSSQFLKDLVRAGHLVTNEHTQTQSLTNTHTNTHTWSLTNTHRHMVTNTYTHTLPFKGSPSLSALGHTHTHIYTHTYTPSFKGTHTHTHTHPPSRAHTHTHTPPPHPALKGSPSLSAQRPCWTQCHTQKEKLHRKNEKKISDSLPLSPSFADGIFLPGDGRHTGALTTHSPPAPPAVGLLPPLG